MPSVFSVSVSAIRRAASIAGMSATLIAAPLSAAADTTHQSTVYTFGPGVQEITVQDGREERPLSGHIWYPTPTPEHAPKSDRSQVWEMAPADPGAEIADGIYPLLVVSHGMFGNTFNQAWLGSELARRGYIVAMVDHPGTSSFLRDPVQAQQLWERPKDLTRLITYITEHSTLQDHIDQSRISAAGHSLGGFTILLAGGARFDGDLYAAGCFGDKRLPVVCEIFRGWSVAETPADRTAMTQSLQDPRIGKIISLDLGGTPLLSKKSLAEIDIPVLVLGSGRADLLDQDLESRALANALPKELVQHIELEDAGHFDFIGVCKPGGRQILSQEEPVEEILCIQGGPERKTQHQRILEDIMAFLAD